MLHLVKTVILVRKMSIMDVDLPRKYVGESELRTLMGCLSMKFLNVMPLELFCQLFQVMCLALKSPSIINCEEGSR